MKLNTQNIIEGVIAGLIASVILWLLSIIAIPTYDSVSNKVESDNIEIHKEPKEVKTGINTKPKSYYDFRSLYKRNKPNSAREYIVLILSLGPFLFFSGIMVVMTSSVGIIFIFYGGGSDFDDDPFYNWSYGLWLVISIIIFIDSIFFRSGIGVDAFFCAWFIIALPLGIIGISFIIINEFVQMIGPQIYFELANELNLLVKITLLLICSLFSIKYLIPLWLSML